MLEPMFAQGSALVYISQTRQTVSLVVNFTDPVSPLWLNQLRVPLCEEWHPA